jgi:1-acyl-sn-glycerol-3-phosphate acyltransferase
MSGPNIPLATYLTAWRFYRRWFRYRTEGFDNLLTDRAALVVGYHGRPFAWDMLILAVEMHERMGYMPHGVIHGAVDTNPVLKWLSDGLGWVTGDGPGIEQAVARGEHVAVVPGGTREGCRSARDRYRVEWGHRTGFVRLALKYGMPIIPVGATGVDDAYVGLNDGYLWGKRLRVPARLPFWIGVGPLGVWPLSPPFPVKIRQKIGPPIDLEDDGPVDPADREALLACHRRVKGAVQDLIDDLRA